MAPSKPPRHPKISQGGPDSVRSPADPEHSRQMHRQPEEPRRSIDSAAHHTVQYASALGNLILGEVGFQREEISHDPSQIEQTETRRLPSAALSDEVKAQEKAVLDENTSSSSQESSMDASTSTGKATETFQSSSTTDDMAVYGSTHYNPENDVLLRLETMTAGEVRMLNLALWTTLLLALGVLLWQFAEKLLDENAAVRSFNFVTLNVAIGGFCFLAVTLALIAHSVRIAYNWKKTWRRRRLITTVLVSVELVAQWVNLAFFLWPNIDLYQYECMQIDAHITTYAAVVRWSCWNTIFLMAIIQAHNSNISTQRLIKKAGNKLKSESNFQVAVADIPFFKAHSWKFLIWLVTSGSTAGMASYVILTEDTRDAEGHSDKNCHRGLSRFQCGIGPGSLGVTSIMLACIILYFILYCAFIIRALRQLRANSNVEFKVANTLVRTQMRLGLPGFVFIIFSVLILWFVKPFSCNAVVNTWLGMLPAQMASTCLVICSAFVGTPKLCQQKGRPPLLQIWLQEFAWSEEEKPAKLNIRNEAMAVEDRDAIRKQPMFCVEQMMSALYWSFLLYDYGETEDSKVGVEDGCGLFTPPLEQYEMIWEKSLDTKAVIAWSSSQIVLGFRGTASLSNVKADVQAWRTVHRPRRGTWFRRPMIHSGFDKAWRTNGFDERIVNKVRDLFLTGEVTEDCKILVTGHSLGGALASLASFSLASLCRDFDLHERLTCITFGAPRTGNYSFVRDYNRTVPDTWNVINDQDIVARGGKMFFMYKRSGHRVLINRLGDLIVRPNPLEASLRLIPCSGSVQQHLLTSYLQSIVSILLVQFKPQRGPQKDMRAVINLIKSNSCFKTFLLEELHIELSELEEAYKMGGSKELFNRYKNQPLTMRKSRDTTKPLAQHEPSLRDGFNVCGCCASVNVWIRDAQNKDADSETSEDSIVSDVDIRDGQRIPSTTEMKR